MLLCLSGPLRILRSTKGICQVLKTRLIFIWISGMGEMKFIGRKKTSGKSIQENVRKKFFVFCIRHKIHHMVYYFDKSYHLSGLIGSLVSATRLLVGNFNSRQGVTSTACEIILTSTLTNTQRGNHWGVQMIKLNFCVETPLWPIKTFNDSQWN